jgi:hypothetical protein
MDRPIGMITSGRASAGDQRLLSRLPQRREVNSRRRSCRACCAQAVRLSPTLDISSKLLRDLPLMLGGSRQERAMGWWFGRKSAPADVRPFVPAWLTTHDVGEGFARSFEGMEVLVRSSGLTASFRGGAWTIGNLQVKNISVDDQQVVGERRPDVPNPSGGGTVDVEARSAVVQILERLRDHGLIARSLI